MNTKLKSLIRSIFLDGVQKHRLSPELQEKEIKKWYNTFRLHQVDTNFDILERFILEGLDIPKFCNKYKLDIPKITHKLKFSMKILKKDKDTTDILNQCSGIKSLKKDKLFWLSAIDIHKKR